MPIGILQEYLLLFLTGAGSTVPALEQHHQVAEGVPYMTSVNIPELYIQF